MKQVKVKSIISMFSFIFLLTSSITLFAQSPDYTPIMNQLNVQQQEMLQNQRQLMLQNRKQLRVSLTEEQLAILGDPDLTREQKREQLRLSFNGEQGELVRNQERHLREVREQFRHTLTQEQRRMLREHLERTRSTRDRGEIRDGNRPDRNRRDGRHGGN